MEEHVTDMVHNIHIFVTVRRNLPDITVRLVSILSSQTEV